MKVRRFKQTGIDRFAEYLSRLRSDAFLAVPEHLLVDDTCTEVLAKPAAIEQARSFETRMQVGAYMSALFTEMDVDLDVGLWSWMGLLYFDSLCPANKAGRKPRPDAYYIPAAENFRQRYRHLLLGPFLFYRANRANPERAAVVLCSRPSEFGEIAEQLSGRYSFFGNPALIELATKLYFDPRTNRTRRGAAGQGPGSARRLADVINQLDRTWDLAAAPWQITMEKLPREFDRFKAPAR